MCHPSLINPHGISMASRAQLAVYGSRH
jgi:hypothetical protein